MSKNLGHFDRFARIFGGSVFLLLSIFVFAHPVARLVAILLGLWGVLEGVTGNCPLYSYIGQHKVASLKPETTMTLALAGIQAAFGYLWWSVGWNKVTDSAFIATFGRTLILWANQNPYPFVRTFLLGNATKFAPFYGFFTAFAEYLIGIVLIALALAWITAKTEETKRMALYVSAVCFAAGAVMNAGFYLASGHIGATERNLNALMFWTQLMFFYGYIQLLLQRPARSKR